MKTSIIIPCYNMGKLLLETLESVYSQSDQDFEVLIVNDGSNDKETLKILSDLILPKGRVINIKNSGLPAARNRGIAEAVGQYILPLDSDDKLHSDYLKKTTKVLDLDQSETLGFVTTDYRFFEGKNIRGVPKDYDPIALAVENCIPVTSLFRKKHWEKVGGYNEILKGYQDWSFWISLVAIGYRWEVIREELFYYRDRMGSMLKSSDKRRGELAREIFEIHREFYEKNSEEIIKSYAHRVGELWAKCKGLQEENKALKNSINNGDLISRLKKWFQNEN